MSVVTLAAAKTFLNITSTTHDAELQSMIDRAEAVLAKRVGPLAPVTVTGEVHTGPGPLLLRRYPVLSVASATSGGVAVSDVDADADAGVVYGTFSRTRRAVRVTYTAGRTAPLPADLEAAVLELTGHLWQTQRGNAPSATALQGDEGAPSGGGFLLPYRVQSLIEPHLLPVGIA